MTTWKPDFDPSTEIHYGLSTNGSGYKLVPTGFNKVFYAEAQITGSSNPVVQVTGLTLNWSGGAVAVFVNASAGGLLNVSTPFAMLVKGIQ